jgi:hypothetical protein
MFSGEQKKNPKTQNRKILEEGWISLSVAQWLP